MSIFQKSVINKYLKTLDIEKVNIAREQFDEFYGDKLRLYNIMQLKEENYQEGFLREVFVDVLGYTINPNTNYNLTTEFKNQVGARKADGAILKEGKATGVIELKSTKTKDLDKVTEQAFNYKNNQPGCRYVITSNFQKLRFYIDNATEYEEFNLFAITKADSDKEFMGLQTWKNSPEGRILKSDTKIAKNYLSENGIKSLERTISSFFDYIERIIETRNSFTMEQFAASVNKFLDFNEYKILEGKGKISAKQAEEKAFEEYDKFNKTQKIESDFDKMIKSLKNKD